MFTRFFVAAAALLVAGSMQAQAPAPAPALPDAAAARSPRNANYRIQARLDHPARTITGRQVITWRNITSRPAATLQFHLYYNGWRNTRSTWMRERILAGDTALGRRPEADWSFIDITSMRILRSGGPVAGDVTSALRFIAPDDGNADDRTVVEAPLEAPVAPGETIEIQVERVFRQPL